MYGDLDSRPLHVLQEPRNLTRAQKHSKELQRCLLGIGRLGFLWTSRTVTGGSVKCQMFEPVMKETVLLFGCFWDFVWTEKQTKIESIIIRALSFFKALCSTVGQHYCNICKSVPNWCCMEFFNNPFVENFDGLAGEVQCERQRTAGVDGTFGSTKNWNSGHHGTGQISGILSPVGFTCCWNMLPQPLRKGHEKCFR